MTPDELRSLADEATPGPWKARVRYPECLSVGQRHVFHTRMRSAADAELAALAPDLARLCAELAQIVQNARVSEWPHGGSYEELIDDLESALAKLSELKT